VDGLGKSVVLGDQAGSVPARDAEQLPDLGESE